MATKKKEPIGYKIKDVDILVSELHTPDKPIDSDMAFNFDVKLHHRVDFEENVLSISSEVNITGNDKKTKFGRFVGRCIYHIDDIKKYKKSDSDQLELPMDFVALLNGISLSTLRGMMFMAYRGTILHNAVLPLIDPRILTPENG